VNVFADEVGNEFPMIGEILNSRVVGLQAMNNLKAVKIPHLS